MKKNKGAVKLLEGALAGAAMGAAAALLLAPESGKALRADMKKKAAEVYKSLAPQLKKLKKMGDKEYNILVKKALQNYGKAKKLSKKEANELEREAKKVWSRLKKHL